MKTSIMIAAVALGAALAQPAPAAAAARGASAWHFNFQQGSAEYATGLFTEGHSNLALYCDESGMRPGTASLFLKRAGFTPGPGTLAIFRTERGSVALRLDRKGSVDFTGRADPLLRTLWRLLTTSRSLQVSYGPGQPVRFSLAGARALLGPTVCPAQLAR